MAIHTLKKSKILSIQPPKKLTLTFIAANSNDDDDDDNNSRDWLHTPTLAVQDDKQKSKNLKVGQSMTLEAGVTYKIKAGFADCTFEIKPAEKTTAKKTSP